MEMDDGYGNGMSVAVKRETNSSRRKSCETVARS